MSELPKTPVIKIAPELFHRMKDEFLQSQIYSRNVNSL